MKGLLLVIVAVMALQINSFMGRLEEAPSYTPYIAHTDKKLEKNSISTKEAGPLALDDEFKPLDSEGAPPEHELNSPADLSDEEKLAALLDQCVECSEVISDINKISGSDLSPEEIMNMESLSLRVGLLRENKDLYLLLIAKDSKLGKVSNIEAIYDFLENPF